MNILSNIAADAPVVNNVVGRGFLGESKFYDADRNTPIVFGYFTVKGVKYKVSGWSKVSKDGSEFTGLKVELAESKDKSGEKGGGWVAVKNGGFTGKLTIDDVTYAMGGRGVRTAKGEPRIDFRVYGG